VDVRLENARPGEHVSVSARAFMLESATAFFAATGETTTPGSVRLEGNLGVGRYRLYASSPDRHQRATRDIVITRPGQYLEVVLTLDSQERLGELRIALPRGASRDRVALLRRCTAPDRTPWALQQVVARKGAVRLQGLRAGTYDVVLLRDGTSGACVQGLEILAQATTPWEPTWVPAMRARMPRLGDLDSPVARAHLAWRGAPALPLYVAQPGFLRTWKADVPPAAGTLLGPFPADRVDLVLELEDGSETRRTLVTRGR
jgi:hypothetical protein